VSNAVMLMKYALENNAKEAIGGIFMVISQHSHGRN
jgi:hypothetical protein